MKVINRRARRDYELLEKLEAGISLSGPEVKSVKEGKIRLEEAFVRIRDGEAWLYNARIHPYRFADTKELDASRPRRLLLHKKEILALSQKIKQKRLTIVPVACYTRGRTVKLEIALARGKKKYEKRQALKKKDIEREIEQELRGKK